MTDAGAGEKGEQKMYVWVEGAVPVLEDPVVESIVLLVGGEFVEQIEIIQIFTKVGKLGLRLRDCTLNLRN